MSTQNYCRCRAAAHPKCRGDAVGRATARQPDAKHVDTRVQLVIRSTYVLAADPVEPSVPPTREEDTA